MDASDPIVRPSPPSLVARPGDVLVGAVASGRDIAIRAVEYTAALAGITARLVWHGSGPFRALVPGRVHALVRDVVRVVESDVRSRVADLADRGDLERRHQAARLSEVLDRLVPVIVAEVVTRIDVTELVAEHVDLDALAERIDVAAIVERLDLAGITDDVLEEIDLPAIIRESTGSLGSAAMSDVRMRAVDADQAVARLVDRILRRASR